MPNIHSSSSLDAAVCEAKLRDAMLPRHGKAGPARQGQAAHRVLDRYLTHLLKEKLPTDFLELEQHIAPSVRAQLGAEDKAIVDVAMDFLMSQAFDWLVEASVAESERAHFISAMTRAAVDPDRVHTLTGPVFRMTSDLAWRGRGPLASAPDGLHIADWKTHRIIEHVKSPAQLEQLRRYAAAHPMRRPDEGATVWLGFVRQKYWEHHTFEAGELEQGWLDLRAAVLEADNTLDRLGLKVPSLTVGPHCVGCDLRRGCDAALRYPFELPLLDNVAPAQLVTAKKLVDELKKDYDDKLKRTLVALEGPVSDGSYTADFSETEQRTFARSALLEHAGQWLSTKEIDQLCGVSTTRLEAALRKAKVNKEEREILLAQLAGTSEVKKNTTLRVSKVKQPRAQEDGDGVSAEADEAGG